MKQLRGATALVTGASGGIGGHLARALAAEGMHVVVSGRREDALAALVGEIQRGGVRAAAVPADLSDLGQAESLIERAEPVLGAIDVLVNNAGIEIASSYSKYTVAELTSIVNLNLTAAMLLTHAALPGMLSRRRGHVVFISSVGGKFGPPYQAPYAATKAGLIGLTQSLRGEYRRSPVGFSVVCPGFVAGDGMYERGIEQGLVSNRLMGTTTTARVAERVVTAIRDDRPEVIESGVPIRPMLALGQLAPRLVERAAPLTGLTDMMRRGAALRGKD